MTLEEQVDELYALAFGGPPLPPLHAPWFWQQRLPDKLPNEFTSVKIDVSSGGAVTITIIDSNGVPLRRVVWGTHYLLDAGTR